MSSNEVAVRVTRKQHSILRLVVTCRWPMLNSIEQVLDAHSTALAGQGTNAGSVLQFYSARRARFRNCDLSDAQTANL